MEGLLLLEPLDPVLQEHAVGLAAIDERDVAPFDDGELTGLQERVDVVRRDVRLLRELFDGQHQACPPSAETVPATVSSRVAFAAVHRRPSQETRAPSSSAILALLGCALGSLIGLGAIAALAPSGIDMNYLMGSDDVSLANFVVSPIIFPDLSVRSYAEVIGVVFLATLLTGVLPTRLIRKMALASELRA